MTATETKMEIEITAEQQVHADLYQINDWELMELQRQAEREKKERDDGGEICGVCRMKGCRIGPMVRG